MSSDAGPNINAILAVIVLLVLSAVFSATETAYSSLNRIRVKNLASSGNKKASKVMDIVDNKFDDFLSAVLIGNNIVNIGLSSLMTLLFVASLGDQGAAVSTLVTTIIVLIFGEISPKSLAKERPESFALFMQPMISFLMAIFKPLTLLFSGLKKVIAYLIPGGDEEGDASEELITMVEEATDEGDLDEHESDLITNAIEFNDLEVKEVLTPRIHVKAIDVEDNFEDVLEVFTSNPYSRIPVYQDTIDNIIGVIHERDFFTIVTSKKELCIKKLITPVIYTSESTKISNLLRQLQQSKIHMAVVMDEYGGTSGIITMEDILEELVGDIYDEHDVVTTNITQINETTYIVKANEECSHLFELLELDDDDDIDSVTVSGWLTDVFEGIPEIGTTYDYHNLHIEILKVDNKRILEVKVTLVPHEQDN